MEQQTIRLKPISFAEIDGWAADDQSAALPALVKSCRRRPAANSACKDVLALGDKVDRDAARRFFETHYIPYRVEEEHPGLVTGYYEPEVNGSRERTGKFQVPVYGRPDDLVQVTPDLLRAFYNDGLSVMRRNGEELVPYYTRAEIESGALSGRGLELLYLDDPVELFFMQIQGSGRVRLTDGSWVRLGYAAKNGHPYTSIGKRLAERSDRPKDLTMEGLKSWLRADPARGRALMQENKSYVFFRELPQAEAGEGPVGAQGVPLTPGRSLAVDAAYHKLGSPVFVTAPDLKGEDGKPFRRLMIAQDVGSAIRGPERGDIFFGTGDAAGAIAGTTHEKARFFILLPKH
ncbi:MAG TPA: MltA domain-containing protein [Methyloceanibacter sp.]|nr:MltA domain-containing protein [Methyloceanibacter sp.]